MKELLKLITVILNGLFLIVLTTMVISGDISFDPQKDKLGLMMFYIIMISAPVTALIQILRKPG